MECLRRGTGRAAGIGHPLTGSIDSGTSPEWNGWFTYCLYLSSKRSGCLSASRRNGSPSSWLTILSSTVVLPSDCALQAACNAAPT
ncbi:hypothetical protein G6F32_014111 [Rhizopus arrhizus]|nr:hypothetical protein G6F32_014111 [Rhizopus arrhizus]